MSDRSQTDKKEMRDDQIFPSSFVSASTHSKDLQQQVEFSGSYNQRSRNGDGGGNMSVASHRRGAPTSKLSNLAGSEANGKGNKRVDRNEDFNNSRRKGKMERANLDHPERQRDSGPANFNSKGGGSEVGSSQSSYIPTGDPSHFQNGVIEHKRTGPIKPQTSSCPPNREPPPPKRNNANNPGSKRRGGQGKGQGPRGSERGHISEHMWKPGVECLALYWEDSKVRHPYMYETAIVNDCRKLLYLRWFFFSLAERWFDS